MKSTRQLLAKLVSFSLLLIMLSGCDTGADKYTQATAKVERRDLVQRISVSGTIEPKRKALVRAPYNSYVRKIYVKLGQAVKQGSPLVALSENITDPGPFFPLRAPFTGRVVQIAMEENEQATATNQDEYILRVDDQSEFHVSANVPEVDVLKIKEKQEAIIRVSAIIDKQYKGEVTTISLAPASQANQARRGQQSVSFPIEISVLNPDEEIRGGMSVLVDIVADRRNGVLVLPHEYIAQDQEQYFVTLADGTRKNIKLGMRNEMYSEVQNLEEGDEVRQVNFYELQGQGL